MNQLLIQVRKDLKLLSTDARFILLIVALAAIAFLMSLMVCTSYVSSARSASISTAGSIILAQKSSLSSFWAQLTAIDSAIFIVAGSLAMSAEKDTGMLRFILTSGCDKRRFYASKFIVLVMMVGITIIISLVAFVISFTLADMPTLGLDLIIISATFPALILLIFSALGLFLASVSKKKAMAVVMAIFLFFLMTTTYSLSISMGSSQAYNTNQHVTVNNVTDYIPTVFKAIDLSNPTVLSQGTYLTLGLAPEEFASVWNPVFFDLWGGIALGLAMLVGMMALGYLVFRTERLDKAGDNRGMIGRILGK
jgi:ABC-type transport system involved in multi-copper enzyme maturation permease subunit